MTTSPLPEIAAHCADLTTRTGIASLIYEAVRTSDERQRWRLPAGLSEEQLLNAYGGLRVAKEGAA